MSKNYSCALRHKNKGIYEWHTNRKVTELIQFKSEVRGGRRNLFFSSFISQYSLNGKLKRLNCKDESSLSLSTFFPPPSMPHEPHWELWWEQKRWPGGAHAGDMQRTPAGSILASSCAQMRTTTALLFFYLCTSFAACLWEQPSGSSSEPTGNGYIPSGFSDGKSSVDSLGLVNHKMSILLIYCLGKLLFGLA